MGRSLETEPVIENGVTTAPVGGTTEKSKEEQMTELLDKHFPSRPLRKNDIVDGKVIAKPDHEIGVAIGHKSEGVVPLSEARSLGEQGLENLKEGEEVIVFVITPEDKDGRPLLSIDKARGEQGWRSLERAMESKETMEGVIVGSNRGGAVVESQGVQGFVPVSQLVGKSRELYQGNDETPKEGFLGLEIEFKVVEINRRRNRAIFSQREAIQAWKKAQKARLVEELKEGSIQDGTVVGISTFGAFVDLGGADGLIHISEMSWEPIKSPGDVVAVGDKIKVYVLSIDKESLRIALSLRRLEPEPWLSVEDKFKVGDVISGTVTKVTAFGAFVRVDQGIEGLIHVSELSRGMTEHPNDVVSEGQELEMKIIRIDPEKRRMALSLKQLQEAEESEKLEEWNRRNEEADEMAAESSANLPTAVVVESSDTKEISEDSPADLPAGNAEQADEAGEGATESSDDSKTEMKTKGEGS